MQAYCVKCRAKKEMSNPKAITMKNGKPATQGVCPTCGTKMFRIGKKQKPVFEKGFRYNEAGYFLIQEYPAFFISADRRIINKKRRQPRTFEPGLWC